MHHVAVRSKLGGAPRQFKHLSKGARRVLSILFLAGLFFFAILSFSIYVKDPDSNNVRALAGKGRRRSTAATTAVVVPPAAPLRIMVATHNRLFWYFPENKTTAVLHEGEGVHYGVFPGEHTASGVLKSVWNVVRPHNWHPKTSEEHLVQIDVDTGAEMSRVQLKSRFTHDATRRGDKVYIANTEGGEVQELAFPSMKLLRHMRLFTFRQHVNTIAPLSADFIWVVLHNLGKSDVVKVDLRAEPPAAFATIKAVGSKAHGLVEWGRFFVMLDSDNAALAIVDPSTSEVHQRWQAPDHADVPKFLKGLCVVDDIAYFGINVWGGRADRDSVSLDGEIAAVDLNTGTLVWRHTVPSHGLINIVAAPQLGEASTYRAMSAAPAGTVGADAATTTTTTAAADAATSSKKGAAAKAVVGDEGAGPADAKAEALPGITDPGVIAATSKIVAMGYKPKIGGQWSSGQPRLDLKVKDSIRSHEAGISLPLMQVDISAIRERVLNMPEDMWSKERQRQDNAAVDGRADNMAKFKPGVEALFMIFSDQSTEHVYRFPYYDYFKDSVMPVVEQVLGKDDLIKIVRMQFSRMKPTSLIKPHKDMGGYAKFAHRIHIPIVTHPNVTFEVCPNNDDAIIGAGLGGRRNGRGGTGRKGLIKDERAEAQRALKAASEVDDMGLTPGCLDIPMADGMVFELNNRVTHQVRNRSPIKRVQLVVDVAEVPRAPRTLKPGAVCNYVQAAVVCPPEMVVEEPAADAAA